MFSLFSGFLSDTAPAASNQLSNHQQQSVSSGSSGTGGFFDRLSQVSLLLTHDLESEVSSNGDDNNTGATNTAMTLEDLPTVPNAVTKQASESFNASCPVMVHHCDPILEDEEDEEDDDLFQEAAQIAAARRNNTSNNNKDGEKNSTSAKDDDDIDEKDEDPMNKFLRDPMLEVTMHDDVEEETEEEAEDSGGGSDVGVDNHNNKGDEDDSSLI
jgi:hypothetical protein